MSNVKVEKQAPVAWKNAHAPNGLLRFMTQKQYDANPNLQKYYEPFSCAECEKLKAERDELAAQVEKMREFLQFLWRDAPLNEYTFARLEEMIALPDLSTGILNRVRAEALNAKRYRWLREQHWKTSDLCAVSHPNVSVKLGYECPSGERLDVLIDRALAADMEAGK